MQQGFQKAGTSYSNADIQTLKDSVDINALLVSLGFKIDKENRREIRCSCAIHGGDNTSAFRFNVEKRTWICFTNRCQDDHGYDIIGLIKGALHTDFKGAVDHLKTLVGDIESNAHYLAEKKFNSDRNSFIRSYSKPKKPEYVNDDHLITYRPLRSQAFIRDAGFTKKTLDYFEIAGGFTDDYNVLRDIVPIRDVNGDLEAYSLKDVRKNPPDTSFKYILTEGFIKDKTLYNLHNAKIYGSMFPIIVVEGFKSVWRLYDYGFYNVVCTMGSFVSDGQMELLKAHAVKGTVLMFDQDKAGRKGGDIAEEWFNKAGIPHSIIKLTEKDVPDGDGPAELSLEQAYGYFNEFVR